MKALACAASSSIGAGLIASGTIKFLQDHQENALRADRGATSFYYSGDTPAYIGWGIAFLVFGILTYVFTVRGKDL